MNKRGCSPYYNSLYDRILAMIINATEPLPVARAGYRFICVHNVILLSN